jgi:catechol-2,3-dioxygenase
MRQVAATDRMGAVQVTELGHIVLFVRDLDRSASLYTNVLGFRPVIDRPSGQRGACTARHRNEPIMSCC